MRGGWVYMLASKRGTLYIGVTSDLSRRILEHRSGIRSGFAHKYGCNRLVYFEEFETITAAIARETELKGWTRTKKKALVERKNPEWRDLAQHWGDPLLLPNEPIAEQEKLQNQRIQLCLDQ
jgi:putative endonuclease